MSDSFSDWQVEQWLESIRTNCWLGLAYSDPQINGAYASEVFGESYERLRVTFGPPSARGMANTNHLKFAGLPTTNVTHFVGWNAKLNGDFRFKMQLPEPRRIVAGGTISVAPGELVLSIV